MLKRKTIDNVIISLLLIFMAIYSCISMVVYNNIGDRQEDGRLIYLALGMLIICFCYIFFQIRELHRQKKDKLLKSFILFLGWLAFCLLLAPISTNFQHGTFNVLDMLLNICLILTFYLYTKRNGVSNVFLLGCLGVMLLMIVQYIQLYTFLNVAMFDVHMGVAYFPMLLLPLVLLYPSKIVQYSSIIIIVFVIFSSVKRAGLIALALGLIAYVYIQNTQKKHNYAVFKYLKLFTLLGVMGVAFILLGTMEGNNIFERFASLEDDGGSGRIDVWTTTWNMIFSDDLFSFLVGHGLDAVRLNSPLGLSAHNDFLEIWYDYGLIGFVLLLNICFQWCVSSVRWIKDKNKIAPVLTFLGIIVVVLLMVSVLVIYPSFKLVLLSLGVFLGLKEFQNENNEYVR